VISMTKRSKQASAWGAAVFLLMLVPIVTLRNDVLSFLLTFFLYITLAQSWNLIGGYAGQMNLGHGAFFGLGVIISRHLWLGVGLPIPLAIMGGALAALLMGLIIGIPAFRLKDIYFVMGTLVFAEILRIIVYTNLPRASVMPMNYLTHYSLVPRYYLSLVVAVIAIVVMYVISKAKVGLGLTAIREDEDAAGCLGVGLLRHKLFAFTVSTFFAGMAGGVFAYYSVAVTAGHMFEHLWTFDAVIIAFVGGVGTILGPVVGAVFFAFLKQFLSMYMPEGVHVAVFGVLFILVVLLLPGGLIELIRKIRGR